MAQLLLRKFVDRNNKLFISFAFNISPNFNLINKTV